LVASEHGSALIFSFFRLELAVLFDADRKDASDMHLRAGQGGGSFDVLPFTNKILVPTSLFAVRPWDRPQASPLGVK